MESSVNITENFSPGIGLVEDIILRGMFFLQIIPCGWMPFLLEPMNIFGSFLNIDMILGFSAILVPVLRPLSGLYKHSLSRKWFSELEGTTRVSEGYQLQQDCSIRDFLLGGAVLVFVPCVYISIRQNVPENLWLSKETEWTGHYLVNKVALGHSSPPPERQYCVALHTCICSI